MPTSQNSAILNDGINHPNIDDVINEPSFFPEAYVSLETIKSNYASLSSFVTSAETSAVVKANAYGHGMAEVGTALLSAGCRTFFVAYLSEGIALRKALGSEPTIYVFNGIRSTEITTFSESNLSPVCNQVSDIVSALQLDQSTGFALHFDTGMNRLGLSQSDMSEIADHIKARPPNLMMSHLACADLPGHEMNAAQLSRFSQIKSDFPESKASLSATAGIYLGEDYHHDLVRPGIGLYGGGPARPAGVKLAPALTLTAPILKVFDVPEGETIGYAATFQTKRPIRVATVSLGYADGYLRSAGNYGFAVLAGIPCPVLGRISMDLTTIDVSDLPTAPRPGDRVEFLGKQAGLEIQAEAAGSIGYELTSRLGGRIRHVWGE